jgi:hypothetical protein
VSIVAPRLKNEYRTPVEMECGATATSSALPRAASRVNLRIVVCLRFSEAKGNGQAHFIFIFILFYFLLRATAREPN